MDPTLRIYGGVRKPRNLLVGRANCYVTRVVGPIQARGGMGGRWGELRPFSRVIGVQHVLCYLRRTPCSNCTESMFSGVTRRSNTMLLASLKPTCGSAVTRESVTTSLQLPVTASPANASATLSTANQRGASAPFLGDHHGYTAHAWPDVALQTLRVRSVRSVP